MRFVPAVLIAVSLLGCRNGEEPEPTETPQRPAERQVELVYPRAELTALLSPYRKQLKALFVEANGDPERAKQLGAAVRALALDARRELEAIEDPTLARAAALEWAWQFGQFGKADWLTADDMRWVIARVPADDPLWALLGIQIHFVFVYYLDDPTLTGFRAALAEQQRDPELLAQLLLLDIVAANERSDLDEVQALYTRLARDHAGTQAALIGETRYDPARPLMPGKPMPEWSHPTLDGEGVIDSEQLRGRPYLLDVWSTYCSPCVAEMPRLHEAHAELGDAIVFVALSIDETREAADEFRRDQWPMPWVNAWLSRAERDALFQAWRFAGIPLTVLVDAEGTIVAVTESLRGDALLPTLRAVLDNP